MSKAEERFLEIWLDRITGLDPVRQHKFHPIRKWMIDFAWPEAKVGIEIVGGTWKRNSAADFFKDCEKLNTAQLMGWKMLQFTPRHFGRKYVDEMIDAICQALGLELEAADAGDDGEVVTA